MTPEQTIELANQAGITFITKSGVASATEEWLVEFARLVGNAKLEEAMKQRAISPKKPQGYYMSMSPTHVAKADGFDAGFKAGAKAVRDAIRGLKS